MSEEQDFTITDFLVNLMIMIGTIFFLIILSVFFAIYWKCAGGNLRTKNAKNNQVNKMFDTFQRQLERSSYKGSVEILLQHMLKTKKEDWYYQKKEYGLRYEHIMTHCLFKDVYLQVKEEPIRTNMSKRSIRIVRGKKRKPLFEEAHVSEIHDLYFVCDSILTDKRSFKAFAEHMWVLFESYVPSQKEEEDIPLIEYKTIATILRAQEALTRLQKEKNWLSSVSFHRISETLPYDLAQLHEVYHTMEEDTQAKELVEQALINIQEKIMGYEQEILANKRLKLEQIENVIKKR